MLVRLIYASIMKEGTTVEDLNAILRSSRRNNPPREVSGILCYTTKYFLQWLEGPREEVNELYNTLVKDERHRDCTILDYAEVQKREFGSWGMAFISKMGDDRDLWMHYVPGESMNPYGLTQKNAAAFLLQPAKVQQDALGEGPEPN